MKFFNTTPETQKRLAVLVPIVALGVSLFSVYPKWQTYSAIAPKVEQQRAQLTSLRQAVEPKESAIKATVPALPTEAPEFVGQVNEIAREANCKVTAFDLKPSAGSSSSDSPIRTVRSVVTLIASYSDIRRFVDLIGHAPRVIVITDLTLVPTPGTKQTAAHAPFLQATVEIERYVVNVEK